MLEQVTRELTVEALPTEIPDSLQHDVSTLVIGDTVTLVRSVWQPAAEGATAPDGTDGTDGTDSTDSADSGKNQ